MTRLANPLPIFLNARGALLDGGSIYVGEPGTDPAIEGNRIDVFWDAGRTIPAAQPLRTLGGVVVNAGSPALVHVGAEDYSIRINDADGLPVLFLASTTAAAVQYQPLASGLTALAGQASTPFGRGLLNTLDASGLRDAAGLGSSAILAKATAADYRANVPNKVLTTDQIWAAALDLPIYASGGVVGVDLAKAFNFSLVMTAGPWTLAAPTNAKAGQSGTIEIFQDPVGGRVLNFDSAWRFAGGVVPALSTAPNSLDVLSYRVLTGGGIYCGLGKSI